MSKQRKSGSRGKTVGRGGKGLGAQGTEATPPSAIAARCRAARGAMTIARLAKRAKVSNRSIGIIEDGSLPAELRAGKDRDRKMRTWAFVLAKLALALDQDPDSWIEESGIELPASELKVVKSAAKRRVTSVGRGESDTLAKLRAELQAKLDEQIPVDVHLLTSDESTLGQKAFYDRLCKLVLRTINPRLEPRPSTEVRTFEGVMEGLTNAPPRHRLVVGAFQMVGRAQHGVLFIPIPGWRIRIGALALPQSEVTWEHIRQSGKGLSPRAKSELRVLVIAREAGDVYLRSFCDFTVRQIQRIPEYHIQGAADAFHQELKRNPRAVLVIGEYEAAVVRSILRDKQGYDLVDLAAEAETAPRYQLALAVAESDERWAETLRNAIGELFKNAGAMMAELYGQYMMAVIDEIVAGEETQGQEPPASFRRILGLAPSPDSRSQGSGQEAKQPGTSASIDDVLGEDADARRVVTSVPSYLQLHEIEFPVTNAFRHGLHDFLQAELRRRELVDSDEPFEPYFRRLAPWLKSDTEKTLDVARLIWSRLEQVAAEQVVLRGLLRQIAALAEGQAVGQD